MEKGEMMEIQDRTSLPRKVFTLADDEQDQIGIEDLRCRDVDSLANDKDIEHLIANAPMSRILSTNRSTSSLSQRGDSVDDCELACILDEENDAGNGLPAWQGFFDLPG